MKIIPWGFAVSVFVLSLYSLHRAIEGRDLAIEARAARWALLR